MAGRGRWDLKYLGSSLCLLRIWGHIFNHKFKLCSEDLVGVQCLRNGFVNVDGVGKKWFWKKAHKRVCHWM